MPDLVDKLGLSNPMANGSRVSQAKFSPHCHRLVFGTISFSHPPHHLSFAHLQHNLHQFGASDWSIRLKQQSYLYTR